jgi:hypothetical protein
MPSIAISVWTGVSTGGSAAAWCIRIGNIVT